MSLCARVCLLLLDEGVRCAETGVTGDGDMFDVGAGLLKEQGMLLTTESSPSITGLLLKCDFCGSDSGCHA